MSKDEPNLNFWMTDLRITGNPPGWPLRVIKEEILSSHMRVTSKEAFESRLMVSGEVGANFQYVGREQLPRIYFNDSQIELLIDNAVRSGVNIENVVEQFGEPPLPNFWVELRTKTKETVRVVYSRHPRPSETMECDKSTTKFDYITDVFVEYSDKHKEKYRMRLSRASCHYHGRDLAIIHTDIVSTSSVLKDSVYYQLAAGPFARVYFAIQFAFQVGLVCKKDVRMATSYNPKGGPAIVNPVQDYGICFEDTKNVASDEQGDGEPEQKKAGTTWNSIQLRSVKLA